jgi:hypothetical protein
MSEINEILGRGPQDVEDFYKTNVQDPTLEAMERDIVPAARSNALGSGNLFTGQHQEAESRLWEDMLDSLLQARSGLALGYEESNRAQELAALGLIPGYEATDLAGRQTEYGILADILGEERAQQYKEYQAIVAQAEHAADEAFRRAQLAADLATRHTVARTKKSGAGALSGGGGVGGK